MDKIILGYDFTENTDCALNVAFSLAEKANCVLELVWVDNSLDDLVQIVKETIRQRIEEILRTIVSQNHNRLPAERLTYSIIDGTVYEALAEKANFEDAALIIIGTHTVGGLETRWTQNNASKLVEMAKCPVLTVPLDSDDVIGFKHIIFPVDFTFSTREKAPIIAWLAQGFGSYIYILGLLTSGEELHVEKVEEYVHQVARFFVNNQVEYEIEYRKTKNLAKEILSFADEKHADMIAVMTKQETAMKNILLGSYTHQIILNSKVPVLTMKPLDINTLDQENLGS